MRQRQTNINFWWLKEEFIYLSKNKSTPKFGENRE